MVRTRIQSALGESGADTGTEDGPHGTNLVPCRSRGQTRLLGCRRLLCTSKERPNEHKARASRAICVCICLQKHSSVGSKHPRGDRVPWRASMPRTPSRSPSLNASASLCRNMSSNSSPESITELPAEEAQQPPQVDSIVSGYRYNRARMCSTSLSRQRTRTSWFASSCPCPCPCCAGPTTRPCCPVAFREGASGTGRSVPRERRATTASTATRAAPSVLHVLEQSQGRIADMTRESAIKNQTSY